MQNFFWGVYNVCFLFQTILCSATFLRFSAHAQMYMFYNVMSVDARALCKYIFRRLPRSKCFSVKHALCAPYAHFGMQSVQMELWRTTLLSHFNIDRYQVCAHEYTFKKLVSQVVCFKSLPQDSGINKHSYWNENLFQILNFCAYICHRNLKSHVLANAVIQRMCLCTFSLIILLTWAIQAFGLSYHTCGVLHDRGQTRHTPGGEPSLPPRLALPVPRVAGWLGPIIRGWYSLRLAGAGYIWVCSFWNHT